MDNGGGFLDLRSLLATHGITHLTTPPHTLEHNGYSEHLHQHIIEMFGLVFCYKDVGLLDYFVVLGLNVCELYLENLCC